MVSIGIETSYDISYLCRSALGSRCSREAKLHFQEWLSMSSVQMLLNQHALASMMLLRDPLRWHSAGQYLDVYPPTGSTVISEMVQESNATHKMSSIIVMQLYSLPDQSFKTAQLIFGVTIIAATLNTRSDVFVGGGDI